MNQRTALSLLLLGVLLIGALGLYYRVGSVDATKARQQQIAEEYKIARAQARESVGLVDSPEALSDEAGNLRDARSRLKRIQKPAQGKIKQNIALQIKQIDQMLALVQMQVNFTDNSKRERSLKLSILQMEKILART